MDIQTAYKQFLEDKQTYCEEKTINYYVYNLAIFFKFLNQNNITMNDNVNVLDRGILSQYVKYLRVNRNIRNTTLKTYIRAIKVFYTFLYIDLEVLEKDYVKRLRLPKSDNKIKMPLTEKEVNVIDNYLKNTIYSQRNFIIFHLMLDTGMRRSEVINLKLADIDFINNYIQINDSKNNKSRIVPLPKRLKEVIQEYIKDNCTNSYLLHDKYNMQITSNAIKMLFQHVKDMTDVKRVHAHLLRHTFATSYMTFNGNIELLRLILGHSSYEVTKGYLHLSNKCKLVNYDIYKIDDIFFKN